MNQADQIVTFLKSIFFSDWIRFWHQKFHPFHFQKTCPTLSMHRWKCHRCWWNCYAKFWLRMVKIGPKFFQAFEASCGRLFKRINTTDFHETFEPEFWYCYVTLCWTGSCAKSMGANNLSSCIFARKFAYFRKTFFLQRQLICRLVANVADDAVSTVHFTSCFSHIFGTGETEQRLVFEEFRTFGTECLRWVETWTAH